MESGIVPNKSSSVGKLTCVALEMWGLLKFAGMVQWSCGEVSEDDELLYAVLLLTD